MNRTLRSLFPVLILFVSCRSVSFYETPNTLRNVPATLHLVNGRSYEGDLSVHTSKHSNSAVKLYTEGDKKPMRFGIHHIKGYELKDNVYELKELKGGIRLAREYSFMKRLTKEGSKIHLYENIRKIPHPGGKHTSSYTSYQTEYFLQLPGDEADVVWNVNSSRFVPGFHEKMSSMVKDCSSLAAKISNKENGFHFAQVSFFKEKQMDVLLNIIEEYNACENQ